MSGETATLDCDQCKEPIRVDASKCPHCGASVVTTGKVIGMMVACVFLIPIASFVAYSILAPTIPLFSEDIDLLWMTGILFIGVEGILLLVYRQRKTEVATAKREDTSETGV